MLFRSKAQKEPPQNTDMTDQNNAHLVDQRLFRARISSGRLPDSAQARRKGKVADVVPSAANTHGTWMQDSAVKAMLRHHSMRITTLRSVTLELTATEVHRLRKGVLRFCG